MYHIQKQRHIHSSNWAPHCFHNSGQNVSTFPKPVLYFVSLSLIQSTNTLRLSSNSFCDGCLSIMRSLWDLIPTVNQWTYQSTFQYYLPSILKWALVEQIASHSVAFYFFPPTTFNLALIQCIISYIIYSKSNEACCSDIPFLALMLLNTLQTNRNCDENTMLSCNAVGGSDFSASSNKTKHDLFIAINIMSSLLLEEFLSITAPSCIIVLWSLGLSVTHCFRPLHQNHIY